MHRRSLLAGWLAGPEPALAWIQAVLESWEQICRRHLETAPRGLAWLVFYDHEQAWHVNAEARRLPRGHRRAGTVRFGGRGWSVHRVPTGKTLWVPDGETLPMEIAPATKPWPKNGKKDSAAYVQMPLPALFWSKHPGEKPAERADELDSLALHELTHTLQMVTVIRQWRGLQARYAMPQAADDDMIETAFRENAEYVRAYDHEKKLLQTAVFAEDVAACREATREAVALARSRQRQFFKPGWTEAEGLWLALEGSAMWVQMHMFLDRAPAGQPFPVTARKMVPFLGSWSQEQGAGLFWVMDRLVPGWKPRYFGGGEIPSPFDVLEPALVR